MKRPSYRHAVEWIAYNDEDACIEEEIIREQVTVLLVSDLFGVDPERVARDVMRKRKAAHLTSEDDVQAALEEREAILKLGVRFG